MRTSVRASVRASVRESCYLSSVPSMNICSLSNDKSYSCSIVFLSFPAGVVKELETFAPKPGGPQIHTLILSVRLLL